MPLYGYSCGVCGATEDGFRPVDMRHDSPEHCGHKMNLDVTGPYVIPDIEAYYDDNLESYVKSRQHRKEVMREKDVYDRRDFKGQRWRNKRETAQ